MVDFAAHAKTVRANIKKDLYKEGKRAVGDIGNAYQAFLYGWPYQPGQIEHSIAENAGRESAEYGPQKQPALDVDR